jgi:hypothetical protein
MRATEECLTGTSQAQSDSDSALSGTPEKLKTPKPSGRDHADYDGEVSPFSSSFFGGRLLNCLHHEVRSRLADAGSGVWTAAG